MKPGYKQTDVGVIPEGWEVTALEKLAHIERGRFTARPRNDPRYHTGKQGSILQYSITTPQLKENKIWRYLTIK